MTTITVMGATGRTGGAITQRLLAQGVHVRALGRSEQRLAALRQQGADTRAGDARDVAYL
ncbi:MAG: azoB 2, partial [Rhizobacter sp.]|nr:azoB 2 [Rhizobacter sp.]